MSSNLINALNFLSKGKYVINSEYGQKTWELFRLGPNGMLVKERLLKRFVNHVKYHPMKMSGHIIEESDSNGFLNSCQAHPQFRDLLAEHPMVTFGLRPERDGDGGGEAIFSLNENVDCRNEHIFKMLTFFSSKDWNFSFQDLVRARRKVFKHYCVNPWSIETEKFNLVSEVPSASIKCTFEDQNFDLGRPITFEKLKVLESGVSDLKDYKIVESETYLNATTLGFLLESSRKRLFVDSSRLALHVKLVPHQVSFITMSDSKDVQDLKQFLSEIVVKDGIRVLNAADDFKKADELGIPFVVVINEESLENGVVLIRDRETCWFEEIHVANVARRLVHIYQSRHVPDSWTRMKQQLNFNN